MLRPSIHIKTKEDVQTLLVILLLAFILIVKCYMLIVNAPASTIYPFIRFRVINNLDFNANNLYINGYLS